MRASRHPTGTSAGRGIPNDAPCDAARPVFRTKQELVYRSLRDAILTCEIPPDERLVIEDVARRLNVSAIPVREALQLLQSEGLVTLIPHVGATVTPLSRDSVVDVFSVLEGLQVVAGRLAAERADTATLAAFEGYVRAMDTAVAATQYDAWADLNTRFHGALSEVSGLKLLQQSTVQALDRWDRWKGGEQGPARLAGEQGEPSSCLLAPLGLARPASAKLRSRIRSRP